MSAEKGTVFVQIREEFRKYFTMTSQDYAIFENVEMGDVVEYPNGSLRIMSGNFAITIHSDAWITWSLEI